MDYFCRWFHRWFHRWQCHVTVRISQFESLGHSVGKIGWRHHAVGETVGIYRWNISVDIYRRNYRWIYAIGIYR
jgi:hypothetical protein